MTDRSQGAYYSKKLSGERLRRCYEIAPARARQYLEAEIRHAVGRLRPEGRVLELGCGYGRVARRLATVARCVVGIDTAFESLALARKLTRAGAACEHLCMDAAALAFAAGSFDAVLCLQNGICAFGVDRASLLGEALRVTREGGLVLFSSYSDKFWPHRLAWFEAQAAEGLVGPVDRAASGNGVIVCTDGFRAGRLTARDFHRLCSQIGVKGQVTEVDESSIFCEIIKPGAARVDPGVT
jgi:2-polyprenyl-6-hydroxyphenyl methylase/3-demethylubiquinone-9 3-methyltransferase